MGVTGWDRKSSGENGGVTDAQGTSINRDWHLASERQNLALKFKVHAGIRESR